MKYMDYILKLIYDTSVNRKILNVNQIEKIITLLVESKKLQGYILSMDVQMSNKNNLACYSFDDKKIIIYSNIIEMMIENIEQNIVILSDFEKHLYKNLSILQIILHEVEHAYQEKIVYSENSVEAFIIRLSSMAQIENYDSIYEFSPKERLAEIKSFNEIINLVRLSEKNLFNLFSILNQEKLQRNLQGYHYRGTKNIEYPLMSYFTLTGKLQLLSSFEWFKEDYIDTLNLSTKQYEQEERFKYGFPVTIDEYTSSIKRLVLSAKRNFKNKVNMI